jgi:hypothetical protein
MTPEETILHLNSTIESQRELIESMSDHNVAGERLNMMKALGARIDYLQNLCTRAADALEKWNVRHRFSDLIDELRKAAK